MADTVTKQEKLLYFLLVNKELAAKEIFTLAKCVSGCDTSTLLLLLLLLFFSFLFASFWLSSSYLLPFVIV